MFPSDLSPERVRSLSEARSLGRIVEFHRVVDSTNTRARDLARSGSPEGTLVLADAQTKGRGRFGRSWVSPPGVNLYASLVLRPGRAPEEVLGLPLVVGLGVAETVAEWAGERTRIKWPNDVEIAGKKVAGVLCELEGEAGRVEFVIAGVGVNLNATEFPEELRDRATSVRLATGRVVDRAVFCARLLERLEKRYESFLAGGFRSLQDEWNRWHGLSGKRIRVVRGGETVEGVAGPVDVRGRLEIRTAGGSVHVDGGEATVLGGGMRDGA